MDDKTNLLYPKNATLYQGLINKDGEDNWVTDDIEYSCSYAIKKNSVVKKYKTTDYLKLLNIEKLKSTDLSNEKNIKLPNNNYISLQELFQIVFGIGCKKIPQINTLKDVEDVTQFHPKFINTQYGKLYKLLILFNKKNKINAWLKVISIKKKKIKKTTDINRISTLTLDCLFLNNLKKQFPKYDGFYAPTLPSDWSAGMISKPLNNYIYISWEKWTKLNSNIINKKYSLPSELGLFTFNKLKVDKIYYNSKTICNILVNKKNKYTKKKSYKKKFTRVAKTNLKSRKKNTSK